MAELAGTKKQNKYGANRLIALLTLVYTASYLCRYSYATVLPEMVRATGQSKTELSVAVTCLFVCYGVGQLISGVLGDILPPKRLVLTGMLVSGVLNAVVPFAGSVWVVRVLWCLNGFAQAFFWPPIVTMMAALLSKDDYARGSEYVCYGGYAGTITLYLLSPLIIKAWSWRGVFVMSSALGLTIAVLFLLLFPDVPPARTIRARELSDADNATGASAQRSAADAENAPAKHSFLRTVRTLISVPMLLILVAIAAQGLMKDGITTWMPTYISELFDLGTGASILTGVLLPVFAMLSIKITNLLYKHLLTNPLVCAAVLFGAGALAALGLFLVSRRSAVFTVLFSVLLAGSMHGVNLMLICMIPRLFKDSGNVSAASGLLNSFTYLGSSLSALGLAAMSEALGWRNLFAVLAGVAVAGGLICFAVRRFRPKTS